MIAAQQETWNPAVLAPEGRGKAQTPQSDRQTNPLLERQIQLAREALRRGDLPAAVKGFNEVLLQSPCNIEALRGLGLLASRRGEFQQAEQLLSAAIRLSGDEASLHRDLGRVLLRKGDHRAAIQALQRTARLEPRRGETLVDLAEAFIYSGRDDEADRTLARALHLDPGSAEAHWSRALLALRRGNYLKGWRGYRWGYEVGARKWQAPPLPEYAGRADPRATVVVWPDAGLLDQVMFSRFLPVLARRVNRVVAQVDELLLPFFRRAFPEVTIMTTCDPMALRRLVPEASDHLAFGDLARILAPDISCLEEGRGYLSAEEVAVKRLRQELRANADERLVGLCWRCKDGAGVLGDQHISLDQFAMLFAQPGLRFVSLQRDVNPQELEHVQQEFDISIQHDAMNEEQSIESQGSFENFVNRIAAVDMVVTVDGLTAHLAGALGRPTHLLLPKVPDWRWGLKDTRSPWYPSHLLHRQSRWGDWTLPLHRLGTMLHRLNSRDS